MIYEFRLSPPGKGRGVSCDANGAFIGSIPLLRRAKMHGRDRWEPRDCGDLSTQLGKQLGLPIDISSKAGGLKAISNALNEGDVARAQIATVLLGIPDPLPLVKGIRARTEMIKFIRDLDRSGMIKTDWDPDEHPRWPAGTPDSQGGQFAPKSNSSAATQTQTPMLSTPRKEIADSKFPAPATANTEGLINIKDRKRSEEECERLLDSDMYVCGSLRDKRERAVCRSSAMARYAACLRGEPLPPLAFPDPDYDFQPLPAPPSRQKPSLSPPWWFFLPWVLPEFGIPA